MKHLKETLTDSLSSIKIYEKKAQITGAAILILMGTEILLDHLGLLPF
jgi:putative Mn2+ efflux pump MntP